MGRSGETGLVSPLGLVVFLISTVGWRFWKTFVVPISLTLRWGKSSSFTNASRKQNWQKSLLSNWHTVEPPIRGNFSYTVLLWAIPSKCLACSLPCTLAGLNSNISGWKWGSKKAFTIYMWTGNSTRLILTTCDRILPGSKQTFRAAWACSFTSSFNYLTPDTCFEHTQCSSVLMLWSAPHLRSAESDKATGQETG